MSYLEQPLVSIITPCFNVENYVAQYLESVLAQSYNNIELILINDGSTDKTEKIIESYQKKFIKKGIQYYYIYQENSGQAAALNKGLAIFKGKYFTWPDADDILSKNNIELKVNFLEKNPEYGLVRGMRRFFKEDAKNSYRLKKDSYYISEYIFYDLIMERTFCNGGCYLMNRDLFLDCYLDKKIFEGLGSQNWQLLVPAASRSKCGYLDADVFFIRIHSDSFSRRKRTLDEWFMRCDDHKKILYDSFLHSVCDIERCKNIVEEKYARKKFNLAFNYNNRILTSHYYKILKKYKKQNKNDTIKHCMMENKCLYNFIRALIQIKHRFCSSGEGLRKIYY